MDKIAKSMISSSLEDEMRTSYLDYAMSVIVGRALPDVRDGLKPVHRRVLFAMQGLNNTAGAAYKKSARIVGDVIGKYHPHGDSAVYDALVRMAQDFSMREVLIDGQGNFGSVDGDAPAAMRYTEVRMARIAGELLMDLDKNTVDFMPNYDESEHEPTVLPTRIPNLLINGSSGIAVGMATNIPPHNLNEVIDATLALSRDADMSIDDIMQYMHGPDFPTAAEINGLNGIRQAYRTGRGSIQIRSVSHFEETPTGQSCIIVTELPYQVNKARLIERIAELVKDKKIEGVSGLRDESDKTGMRVVIELKRGEVPEVVLNHLYKQTALQVSYGINMVALIDGRPQLLNVKQILESFLSHRAEVITRRTLYDLSRARNRAHVLEGLSVALDNIDEMIQIIRTSSTPQQAKEMLLDKNWQAGLVKQMLSDEANQVRPEWLDTQFGMQKDDINYRLSETQAQAILDLRLHRLTGLEQKKIIDEYKELVDKIFDFLDILRRKERLLQVIQDELVAVQRQYGNARLTKINKDFLNLTVEDLIPREERVVTLSREGYIKSQPLNEYTAQRRGGVGRSATAIKEDDLIKGLFVTHSHNTLLCFSSKGRVFWKKVYEIPNASRQARGKPIVNLLPLEEHEIVTAVLPVKDYDESQFVFMATKNGIVKKTSLEQFSRPRVNGIIALTLDDDDSMIEAGLTDGSQSIMLFTNDGKVNHFSEQCVRSMGRTARGVIGIRLAEDAITLAMIICQPQSSAQVLTITENGYGKRSALMHYRIKARGGKGMKAIAPSERNGQVISSLLVDDDDEVMLISNSATTVRIRCCEIASTHRSTKGVRLIRLQGQGKRTQKLVDVARIQADDVSDQINEE